MNGSRRSGFIVSSVCGLFATVLGCSSREGFENAPQVLGSEAGAPDGPRSCVHCSRDLKQVLDGCDGDDTATVVERCGPDQGCGAGRCVDACTAAALNQGSVGCEFWTVPPSDFDDPLRNSRGACFTTIIANTWDRATNITAEFEGRALDISKSVYRIRRENETAVYERLEGPLPPGEVAIVFLSHQDHGNNILCPSAVTPALSIDPIRHNTTINNAFHIVTDAPVTAYSNSPYGGAKSYEPTATLLLPVSAWSRNYVAVTPELEDSSLFEFLPATSPYGIVGKRTLQIVANEDDTQVSIKPTVELYGNGDVAGALAGVTQTWTLQKGQVLQFVQRSITGSPIESNKPIAVFGGSQCTNLPGNVPTCDMLQQQIPPLAHWGTEYAVVPYPSRVADASLTSAMPELVPYTIVAAADGTELTYEPARPKGAPLALGAGQAATFASEEPFVVKSQDSTHPFHVNVYMTSCGFHNARTNGSFLADTLGDPEFVNVPAADQYLDRYVFFTDFTYPETGITVVRRKTAAGFAPVELACGGEITNFEPLGASGSYEWAWVTLTSTFSERFAKEGCSSYGRQEAYSKGPFAVTVWGIGVAASYGYVGGTGLRPINDAIPVPLK